MGSEGDTQRYWFVSLSTPSVVRISRTPLRFENLTQVEASYVQLYQDLAALEPPEAGKRAMLLDFRSSPPARNDAPFEEIHRDHRPRLFSFFRKHAALVSTAAGVMQLTRMSRENLRFGVFEDEDEAFEYLRE